MEQVYVVVRRELDGSGDFRHIYNNWFFADADRASKIAKALNELYFTTAYAVATLHERKEPMWYE